MLWETEDRHLSPTCRLVTGYLLHACSSAMEDVELHRTDDEALEPQGVREGPVWRLRGTEGSGAWALAWPYLPWCSIRERGRSTL